MKSKRFTWLGALEATPVVKWDADKGISPKPARPDRTYIADGEAEVIWEFAVASIVAQPWVELEGVMIDKRPPDIITGVSRIVGYYSFLRNWSGSKLEELKDRHRGQYSIPAKINMKGGYTPDEVKIVSNSGGDMSCAVDLVGHITL